MADAFDMFSEIALVSIAIQGSSDVRFESKIDTIDIDMGEKGFDSIINVAGGRLVKFTPMEDTMVTFEAYPKEAGGGEGFWDLFNAADTSEPQQIDVDHTRKKVRITLLFLSHDSAVPAGGAADAIVIGAGSAGSIVATRLSGERRDIRR